MPFGASAKRGELFNLNKVPGPGAYNPKENQNISFMAKQNINEDYNNKNITKNKSFQLIKHKVKDDEITRLVKNKGEIRVQENKKYEEVIARYEQIAKEKDTEIEMLK